MVIFVEIMFGAVAVVAVGWLLHRFCIKLEDAGYLYYRKPRQGGGGGLAGGLMELDRLVARPSIEHVVELESSVVKQQEECVGGE
jgi:glycerate kinase